MMRLRDVGTWMLWRSGIAAISREILTAKGRFVLEFHNVLAQRETGARTGVTIGVTADELFATLEWVDKRFRFLTADDFLEGKNPGVLLTFDDGFEGIVTSGLPILEHFEAPAVFFISIQHVQDPHNWLPAGRLMAEKLWPSGVYDSNAHEMFDGMSETQLISVGQHPLVTIGSHTVSHPFLTQCDDVQLRFELEESRRYLMEVSGQLVDLFAYPTGDYDRRVAEAVREIGYRAAFAELSRNVDIPKYEIPRVGIYQDNPAYLSLKLSGLHRAAVKSSYA